MRGSSGSTIVFMETQVVIGPATSQTAAGGHFLGSQAGSDLPAIHGGRDI